MTPSEEKTAEERAKWMAIQLEADGILPDGTSLEQLIKELLSLRLTNQRLEAEKKMAEAGFDDMAQAKDDYGEYIGTLKARIKELEVEVERLRKELTLACDELESRRMS